MSILFFSLALIQGIVILIAVLNISFGPFLKRDRSPRSDVFISVLVPARDEENNIENCIRCLSRQDYPRYEIIALDDHSHDQTWPKLQSLEREMGGQLRILKGQALPEGWTGKNWACWQLARAARGQFLVFTDADVSHSVFSLSALRAQTRRHHLDLLSVFPRQETRAFWEKLSVHSMELLLYGFVPLWGVVFLPFNSLALANGQCICVERESYFNAGGHASVRDKVVEDVELASVFKRHRMRIMIASGQSLISCRMYSTFSEMWEGFTKNCFLLFSGPVTFTLIFSLLFTVALLPFILLVFHPSPWSLGLVGASLLWRSLIAVRFRQSPLVTMVSYPLGISLFLVIASHSAVKCLRGSVQWKGRDIRV